MKKISRLSVFLLALPLLGMLLSSFTGERGGDHFAIYLNGKQVHQQFLHTNKGAKSIELVSFSGNDRIEVYYSHCGVAGKNRVLTLRNDKDEVIQELKFPDAKNDLSRMGFYRKDVKNLKGNQMNLYYSSKELPEGKLLATVWWKSNRNVVQL